MASRTLSRPSETRKRLREYKRHLPLYMRLCDEARMQVRDMLERRGVPFSSIDARVKSFSSMSEKLAGKSLRDGQFMTSLSDTAGVRIIISRQSDRSAIARVINETFNVDGRRTKEAALRRSADGYSDDKYYCSLRAPRDLKRLVFELQVQTAMMNAWASIGHDISYKPPYQLPDKVRSRFKLLASLMDLADDDLDTLTEQVISEAKEQSKTRLNTLGLKALLDEVVALVDTHKKIVPIFRDWADARLLVKDLGKCGVKRLDDLRKLANQRTVMTVLTAADPGFLDYSLVVRLILMMEMIKIYFKRVAPADEVILDEELLPILKSLNIDYEGAAQAVGKSVHVEPSDPGF